MTITTKDIAVLVKPMTGEELADLGDIGPCELIEGRLVAMTPTGEEHGKCEVKFSVAIHTFLQSHPLGKVRAGEVGIYVHRNPDTIRAADVLYISNERYAQKQSAGFLDVAPELVVEIVSPSDRWTDITQKLQEYLEIGVRLVWIADPETRRVHAYRAMTDLRVFGSDDELPGDDVLPGFSVQVAGLFED